MAKFKIGDRVINLRDCVFVPKGATGTIHSESLSGWWVDWDEVTDFAASKSKTWTRAEVHLELIETNTEIAIELLKQAIELLSKS